MESVFRHIAQNRTCLANSNTPTYVAMALHIDNWRWAGVPFYLRTGKRLAKRLTQIVIRFRRPPFVLFRNTSVNNIAPNELVISIQPDEGISLSFEAKVPGAGGPPRRGEHEFSVFRLLRHHAVNRVRDAALRLHDGRFHSISARGHGRGRVGRRSADSRRMERAASARLPELCRPAVGGPSRVTSCCGETGVNGAIR